MKYLLKIGKRANRYQYYWSGCDQPGLHGVLGKIRDLGLPLILVEWIHL